MTSLSHFEIVQIVDSENLPIDAQPRHEMRRLNLIHRACYILVFNTQGELFLQKRTADKDVYPSCWDVAAGGVVLAGESYEASALRELEEELGVQDALCLPVFDQYFEDLGNRVWGRIFTCLHNGPFVLQAEEVESGQFLSVDQVLALGESEPFTPDGLAILRRIQGLAGG